MRLDEAWPLIIQHFPSTKRRKSITSIFPGNLAIYLFVIHVCLLSIVMNNYEDINHTYNKPVLQQSVMLKI